MTYKLFLGSGSPRRVALSQQMGVVFEQRVLAVEEIYPQELKGVEITSPPMGNSTMACWML